MLRVLAAVLLTSVSLSTWSATVNITGRVVQLYDNGAHEVAVGDLVTGSVSYDPQGQLWSSSLGSKLYEGGFVSFSSGDFSYSGASYVQVFNRGLGFSSTVGEGFFSRSYGVGLSSDADVFGPTYELPSSLDAILWNLLGSSMGFSGKDSNGLGISFAASITSISVVPEVAAVPIPGALWLFGSALLGMMGLNRRKAARTASATGSLATA